MPLPQHSSPVAVTEIGNLLEQAMDYARAGGRHDAKMEDGSLYFEAFVAAIEESGWKLDFADPKDAETAQALAESQQPDEDTTPPPPPGFAPPADFEEASA